MALRLGNVERQDLLHGVARHHYIDQTHINTSDLTGMFRYFFGTTPLQLGGPGKIELRNNR